MIRLRRRLFFLLLLLLPLGIAVAPRAGRAEEEMVVESVACPILSVDSGEGNVRIVTIDRGSEDGVVPGWRGFVEAVRKGATEEPSNADRLGRAEVLSVSPRTARVRVTLTRPEGAWIVRPGDMAFLSTRVPDLPERSLLWRLAKFGIFLQGSNGVPPYYDFRTLYRDEDPERVRGILDRMVEKIRLSGRQFGDMPALQVVIPKGRYEGRLASDVLVEATREELRTFLTFVWTFPGKYYGQTWNVDEIFATWVINFAPYSSKELADLLVATPTTEERLALLTRARDEELASDLDALIPEIRTRMQDAARAGRFEDAHGLVELIRRGAEILDDPQEGRWSGIDRAWLLGEEDRVEESLAAYDEVIASLSARPEPTRTDRFGIALALHNRGWELERLGRYPEALESYLASLARKEEEGFSAETRSFTHRVAADLLRKLGRHPEAIEHYERAAELSRQLDDRKGLTTALSGRAKALEALGRNGEAAEAYAAILVENRRIGDRDGEADTLENIGSQRWTLGDYATAREAYAESLAIRRELGDRPGVATATVNVARLTANLGRLDDAKSLYEEALALRRELGARNGVASVLGDLAGLAERQGRFEDALALFEEGTALYREVGNRTGEAGLVTELGNLRYSRREFEEALADYARAVALYEESRERSSLADTLRSRGICHQILNDFAQAMADYEAALAITREIAEPDSEAEVLLEIGWLFWNRMEHEPALERTREALAIVRKTGNRLLEGRCLRRIGEIESGAFRAEPALEALAQALAIFADPALNDPAEIATTLGTVGSAHLIAGRFEDALAAYEDQLLSARESGRPEAVQQAHMNLGDVHFLRGDFAKAKEAYRGAGEKVVKNDWLLAQVIHREAHLAHERGEARAAIETEERALGLNRDLRNEAGEAEALASLSTFHLAGGDLARARSLADEALAVAKSCADRWRVADIHLLRSRIARAGPEPDPRRAVGEAESALAIFEELGDGYTAAKTRLDLGGALREIDELEAAEAAYVRARRAFASRQASLHEAEALEGIALVHLDRGDLEAAAAAVATARELVRETGSPHLAWRLSHTTSRIAEARGDLDLALEERRAAIDVLQRLRAGVGDDPRAQRRFLRSKIRIYESMAELIGRRVDVEEDPERKKELVEEALRFIGLAQFEILSGGTREIGRTGSKVQDDLLDRIEKAQREIEHIERKLEEARAVGNRKLEAELTKVLATNMAQLYELHTNLNAVDEDLERHLKFNPVRIRTKGVLPEGARLVLYFSGVEHLFLWVYDSNGFVTWKRYPAPRAEIYSLVESFRGRIQEIVAKSRTSKGRGFGPEAEANEHNPEWYRENCRATRETLEKLYVRLIAPIEEEIEGADPLLIQPFGMLNCLPFEALIDGEGRFLGERTRTAYAMHIDHTKNILGRLSRPAPPRKDVWVGYADPAGKLAESLEEAMEIQALFPEHEVHTALTGTADEGSLERIRTDATILHFATHGYLNGDEPANTWLELAHPPGDGRLMQKEIFPRFSYAVPPLREGNLRLVVLSACETALAQETPEAELLGLPDAFDLAGVPSVVASLWSVYSWSTTDLMIEFYRRVAEDRTDLGSALLGARRALLENRGNARYSHPYYWSAFLLYGDWR